MVIASLALFVADSHAQTNTFVQAVGYVNKDLLPGFSLINVPLRPTDGVHFRTPVPHGFALYFLRGGKFEVATFDESSKTFSGAELNLGDLQPGRGFFVHNPSSNRITLTFVGEVPQGSLTNYIPAGFSIQSIQVPQSGRPHELGCPIDPGDAIYAFDSVRQRYTIHVFDDLELRWLPTPPPVLQTGDAFLLRTLRAKEWVREFTAGPFPQEN